MTTRNVKQNLAVLFLLGMMAMPLAGLAQERTTENTIGVQASATIVTRPDSLQVQVGVETQDKTLEAARNANASRMNAILARLKALNLPGMTTQTAGFSVYPVYDEKPEMMQKMRKIQGYRVSNTINVKVEGVDNDQLSAQGSRIVDTALAAGANHVSGIQFYLSNAQQAFQQALSKAIQQARSDADAMAKAAGVTLTGVYSIDSYGNPQPLREKMSLSRAAMAADAEPTPVEPGEWDVTASVNIRFDFRD